MTNVRNELTQAMELGEAIFVNAIQDLEMIKEQIQDDRLLFVTAQLVEMAHIYVNMSRAARGLWAYVGEDDTENAQADVYEAFQAIEHVHAKAPNERLLVTREYLYEAMSSIKERNIDKSKEVLGSIGMIADTTRLSIIEHLDFIEKRIAA